IVPFDEPIPPPPNVDPTLQLPIVRLEAFNVRDVKKTPPPRSALMPEMTTSFNVTVWVEKLIAPPLPDTDLPLPIMDRPKMVTGDAVMENARAARPVVAFKVKSAGPGPTMETGFDKAYSLNELIVCGALKRLENAI